MASKPSGSRAQTFISIAVLAALAGITAGVWVMQGRFEPSTVAFTGSGEVDAVSSASVFAYILSETLTAAAQPERYDRDNLHIPINGRAEAYLSRGFVSLDYQRFQVIGEPDAWLALWVYDMGARANAFSVFSAQRRPGAPALDLTEYAYASYGSAYFVHGRFYVEVLVADDTPALAAAAHQLAENFVVRTAIAGGGELEGLALLPEAHRIPDSIQLLKTDAFGIAGLDNVWLARYDFEGDNIAAFVSRRDSAAEASALAESYVAFLEQFGAVEGAPDGEPPAGMLVRDLDGLTYILICRGRILAGVNEGPNAGPAYGFGLQLLEHVSEMVDD